MVKARVKTSELMLIVWRLGTGKDYAGFDRWDDLSALCDMHWPNADEEWRVSPVAEKLIALLDDECLVRRKGAAVSLGHIAPCVLLSEVGERLPVRTLFFMNDEPEFPPDRAGDYEAGVGEAVEVLTGSYFGDICPGRQDSVAESDVSADDEYEQLAAVCRPIIEHFRHRPCGRAAGGFLREFRLALVKECGA